MRKILMCIILWALLIACGAVTATPYPTHTPYPTYTPYPTFTPYSTPAPYPSETAVAALPTVTPSAKPAIPTPSPTSQKPAFEIGSASSYQLYDYVHIVGEAINNTGYDAEYVKIVASFYNQDGDFVNSDYTYTQLDTVPAHGKACFDLTVGANPAYDHYELVIQGSRAISRDHPSIQVLNHASSVEYGWLHVKGEVQNLSDRAAEYVSIVATFYDNAGKVIGCDYTYTELGMLVARQKSPFDMGLELPVSPDRYELATEGLFVD